VAATVWILSTATSPVKSLPLTPLNRTVTVPPEYEEKETTADSFHSFWLLLLLLPEHAVYTEDHDPEPDGDWISTERLPMAEP
jgi:hypothetical protein